MEFLLLLVLIAVIAPKNILSLIASLLLIGSVVYIVVWCSALFIAVAVLTSN
jgi:hypothetical protein